MRMHLSDLHARAEERGYTLKQISPCIAQRFSDGTAEVDIHHPAYPHSREPDSTEYLNSVSHPSVLKKAINFVAATVKHVAAGAPSASEEEVARRFAICQGCEHYDGKACAKCGCPISAVKGSVSKLSWADQSCPVGKWGPAENG